MLYFLYYGCYMLCYVMLQSYVGNVFRTCVCVSDVRWFVTVCVCDCVCVIVCVCVCVCVLERERKRERERERKSVSV